MAQAAAQTAGNRREQMAVIVVLLVWMASLAVGWTYRYVTEHATRPVVQGQVSVDAPASWIVEGPSGDLVVVVRNPLQREQSFSILRPPEGAGTLDEAARDNRARAAAQREGYLIGGVERVDLGGKPADRTAYTFVRRDAADRSLQLSAVDYVVLAGSSVLIITFISPEETFERELPAFERFARSVSWVQP